VLLQLQQAVLVLVLGLLVVLVVGRYQCRTLQDTHVATGRGDHHMTTGLSSWNNPFYINGHLV
jgi:hypothetical protein